MINNEAMDSIIETVENLLKALRNKQYSSLKNYVDLSVCYDSESIKQEVSEKLLLSGNGMIDTYGGLGEFRDKYHRCKLQIQTLDNVIGFLVDYEITAGSKPIGLILRLKFIYSPNGIYRILSAIQPYFPETSIVSKTEYRGVRKCIVNG